MNGTRSFNSIRSRRCESALTIPGSTPDGEVRGLIPHGGTATLEEITRAPVNSGFGRSSYFSLGALARASSIEINLVRWPACWARTRSYSSRICAANFGRCSALTRLLTTGTAREASRTCTRSEEHTSELQSLRHLV